MHTFYRREYAESWRKMQELRAQIQAQLKLADTIKKLGEQAGIVLVYMYSKIQGFCQKKPSLMTEHLNI